jgi:hypothetical protein
MSPSAAVVKNFKMTAGTQSKFDVSTSRIRHAVGIPSSPLPVSQPACDRPAQNSEQNDRKRKLQPNRCPEVDHDKLNSVAPRVRKHFGSTLNQTQHHSLPACKKFRRVPKAKPKKKYDDRRSPESEKVNAKPSQEISVPFSPSLRRSPHRLSPSRKRVPAMWNFIGKGRLYHTMAE